MIVERIKAFCVFVSYLAIVLLERVGILFQVLVASLAIAGCRPEKNCRGKLLKR